MLRLAPSPSAMPSGDKIGFQEGFQGGAFGQFVDGGIYAWVVRVGPRVQGRKRFRAAIA